MRWNEPLCGRTTLRLRGAARAWAQVHSEAALVDCLHFAADQGLPPLVIGAGSNLVAAQDLPHLVIQYTARTIDVLERRGDTDLIRVAAGCDWHELVRWSLRRGYCGLENLALIPGCVGAAPVQNIGAYGVELARFVHAIHGYRLGDASPFTLTRPQCRFGYRDSIFKKALRDRVAITALDLRLGRRADPVVDYPALRDHLAAGGTASPTAAEVFEAVVALRRARLPDPARIPNAGSFFKNPLVSARWAAELAGQWPGMPQFPGDNTVKIPAAWLIEQCGWKGARRGPVGVAPGHALVLVNYGGASGGELLALAADIRDSVRQRFGLELEVEPRIYPDVCQI